MLDPLYKLLQVQLTSPGHFLESQTCPLDKRQTGQLRPVSGHILSLTDHSASYNYR